ncbi:MAG: FecR domain-containing protein [Gemmataceae bacterium]|nr:FecR domain-containing protein [Gemmataceae bacterium]
MNRDHLLELLDDYLEGELTEERQTELEALLLQHPEARTLYWDYVQQHMLIQKIEQESDGQALACQESTTVVEACGPRTNSRRRPIWVWGAVAASLLCAAALAYQLLQRSGTPSLPSDDLVLASAEQAVVLRDGAEQPAQTGMVLRWGDRVVVAEDGRAVVRHRDTIRLDIGGDSTLTLTVQTDGGKSVELVQGKVTVERGSDAPDLTISTPMAESHLPGGAGRCLVVAAPTVTRVEVETGTAHLQRKSDQKTTEVAAGAYAVASPGLPLVARPLPRPDTADGVPVLLATWLGGPGANSVSAAAVAPDGSVLLGGTFPGANVSLWQPERQHGQGDGLVLRFRADGTRLLAVMRFEGSVDALRLDDAGNVYVAGSFGSVKLDSTLRQTTWSTHLKDRATRIVPGPDGGAVVLTGNTVHVLDQRGKRLHAWTVADRVVRDIACDAETGQVFVVGVGVADKVGRAVPFVYAYDTKGQKIWVAYDWTPEQVVAKGLGAGSEGLCLALGRDGQLYVAGQAHGGNTVWGRQSQDIDEKLAAPRGDRFQSAYGIGNRYLTFVGRLDARTGRSQGGTVLVGRHVKDQGASMRPGALAVDAEGRIYVGGWAGATPPVSRGAFGLLGQGGGAFLCVFDRDFNRLYAARLCGGKTTALAVGPGAIVAAGDGSDGLTAVRPYQPEALGEDGWLVVFRKSPGIEYESPILSLPRK